MTDASPSTTPESTEGAPPVPVTAFEKRFGHPPGLFILFFTEMWERFSYYGMRGLLKLYMVNYLFITVRQTLQGKAYNGAGDPHSVVGWGFVQGLLPTVDIHDASIIKECIEPKVAKLMAGDAANGLVGLAAEAARNIAEQTCAVSSNASRLYGWYTGLVYLTPLLGGIIADRYLGQRRTVVVGGILMAIGHFVMALENWFFLALLFLIAGNGAFKPNVSTQVGNLYAQGDPRRDGAFTIFYMGINLGAFICNFICGTLAAVYGWHYGFGAAGVGMLLGLVVYIAGQPLLAPDLKKKQAEAHVEAKVDPLTKAEWSRVWALVALCALNVVFWVVYEQQGNTMQTWADEQTRWPVVFGFAIPTSWFQSFNPLCIILLAPVLDRVWAMQAKKGTVPSSVTKMAIGAVVLGLSFIVMVIGAQVVGGGKGSLFWPLFCTLLLTVGELYLSPIGLSLVTKVAPARIVSMMMGMWFLSSFFGNLLSGYVGALYDRMPKEAFFLMLTVLGVGVGVAIWAFNKPLRKAIGSDVLAGARRAPRRARRPTPLESLHSHDRRADPVCCRPRASTRDLPADPRTHAREQPARGRRRRVHVVR
jgi:proton-dependent oligopeptide transporter, POT family